MPRKRAEPEKETPILLPTSELAVAPPGLEGKKASELDVVRWVSRNIDVPHPSPDECPDPFAWTLLRQCRVNPEFTAFFVQTLWAKLIPSRSQVDQGERDGEYDGKPTVQLIDRILKLREEAVKEAAGRKAPAIPDAFSAWEKE